MLASPDHARGAGQPMPPVQRRGVSPRKQKEMPLEQLLEKLQTLEKYKADEEKGRKKEDMQHKKELSASKKRLAREIASTKGNVRKKAMEVTKLKQNLAKLEKQQLDNSQKKQATTIRIDEVMQKAEQKRNATEAELQEKIGQVGESRGTLAYLEYAAEMLEKGIVLPKDHHAELLAAESGRLQALADNEVLPDGLETPATGFAEASALAVELNEMKALLEESQEHNAELERDREDAITSHDELREEMDVLRNELQRLREENESLHTKLGAANKAIEKQEEELAISNGNARDVSLSPCINQPVGKAQLLLVPPHVDNDVSIDDEPELAAAEGQHTQSGVPSAFAGALVNETVPSAKGVLTGSACGQHVPVADKESEGPCREALGSSFCCASARASQPTQPSSQLSSSEKGFLAQAQSLRMSMVVPSSTSGVVAASCTAPASCTSMAVASSAEVSSCTKAPVALPLETLGCVGQGSAVSPPWPIGQAPPTPVQQMVSIPSPTPPPAVLQGQHTQSGVPHAFAGALMNETPISWPGSMQHVHGMQVINAAGSVTTGRTCTPVRICYGSGAQPARMVMQPSAQLSASSPSPHCTNWIQGGVPLSVSDCAAHVQSLPGQAVTSPSLRAPAEPVAQLQQSYSWTATDDRVSMPSLPAPVAARQAFTARWPAEGNILSARPLSAPRMRSTGSNFSGAEVRSTSPTVLQALHPPDCQRSKAHSPSPYTGRQPSSRATLPPAFLGPSQTHHGYSAGSFPGQAYFVEPIASSTTSTKVSPSASHVPAATTEGSTASMPSADDRSISPHGRKGFADAVHKVTAKALREYRENHRRSLNVDPL